MALETYPVRLEVDVAWGDMDALGHVNNTQYFRWFESARIKAFEGIGLVASQPTAMGPILATTTCDFLAPLRYPARVVVGARIPKVGNTSMTMEYAVANATDGALCAKGSGVIVLVDHTSGEKKPIPETMRQAIAALLTCGPPI